MGFFSKKKASGSATSSATVYGKKDPKARLDAETRLRIEAAIRRLRRDER